MAQPHPQAAVQIAVAIARVVARPPRPEAALAGFLAQRDAACPPPDKVGAVLREAPGRTLQALARRRLA